jgi:hypothetical protein
MMQTAVAEVLKYKSRNTQQSTDVEMYDYCQLLLFALLQL